MNNDWFETLKSEYSLVILLQIALGLWAQGNSEFLCQFPFALTLFVAVGQVVRLPGLGIIWIVAAFNITAVLFSASYAPGYNERQKVVNMQLGQKVTVDISNYSLQYWWFNYETGQRPIDSLFIHVDETTDDTKLLMLKRK